jgi:hypothetical protein
MPSIIKVDQIQSDTGNVLITGNIIGSIAFSNDLAVAGNLSIGTTATGSRLLIQDGFTSFDSSDANGYPRFTAASGSAQLGLFRSGTGSVGGGYIGADSDNCIDVRTVDFTTRMRVTQGGDLQFNSGYGSVATAYGCRAWVNWNGTGTVAIRGSGNVSSISDNGTGQYTINFTTAMPDVNYAIAGFAQEDTGGGMRVFTGFSSPSSSSRPVEIRNSGNSLLDPAWANAVIFR